MRQAAVKKSCPKLESVNETLGEEFFSPNMLLRERIAT